MKREIALSLCLVAMTMAAEAQGVSRTWIADQGDGSYKNPVLYADYSNPDVIRVGDDYWLTSASFDCIPALQILHSTDLVNWELAGAVRSYTPNQVQQKHGGGVWSPSIRYHNGLYYIYWGDPDVGIYMTTTDNPRGQWSTPHLVWAGKGMIDPCPLWDDDGKAYLVHSWEGGRAGFKSILSAAEMAPDGKSLIGEEVLIFDGHNDNLSVEGPKFYKRDGWYYIFAPAGGAEEGWQLVMRSSEPLGKYEWRKVLRQGDSDIRGPHQGGWVTDSAGDSWFLYSEDRNAYGRVVHLQPMEWTADGWCTMGIDTNSDGIGDPVVTHSKPHSNIPTRIITPYEGDEFNEGIVGLQWQWFGSHKQRDWAMHSPEGYLRLLCRPYSNLYDTQHLMCQKITAPTQTITAKVRFTAGTDGDRAGMIVHGKDYATLSMIRRDGKIYLSQSICTNADKGASEKFVEEKELGHKDWLWLRIEIAEGGKCRFYHSIDNQRWEPFWEEFTAKAGVCTGAKWGLFAGTKGTTNDGGYMDIDWVRVE